MTRRCGLSGRGSRTARAERTSADDPEVQGEADRDTRRVSGRRLARRPVSGLGVESVLWHIGSVTTRSSGRYLAGKAATAAIIVSTFTGGTGA